MITVYKVLLGLAIAAGFIWGQGESKPFCSYEIRVINSNGTPYIGKPSIEAVNERGEVVAETTAKNGVAYICGLPFGRHDVIVGSGSCSVVLKDVIDSFPLKTVLTVVLGNLCTPIYGQAGRGCFYRIHFVDEMGSPEPGIECRNLKDGKAWVSDEYGRMQLTAQPETTLSVSCQRKPGAKPDERRGKLGLEFPCPYYDWSYLRLTVPR
jgi:hypothetical protein